MVSSEAKLQFLEAGTLSIYSSSSDAGSQNNLLSPSSFEEPKVLTRQLSNKISVISIEEGKYKYSFYNIVVIVFNCYYLQ